MGLKYEPASEPLHRIKMVLAVLMLAPFGVATFRHPAAGATLDTDAVLFNLRTTTSQKCESVPRRARI